MLTHQCWFTALYSQQLLASQSFEFLIYILPALQMPLIRYTNVFYRGRLSRHITPPPHPPPRILVPSLGLGITTPFWQLSPPNMTYSLTKPTANPVGGKACSPTMGGLLRYSQHLLASQSFEFLICISFALQMPLIRYTNVFYLERLSRHNMLF